jgi:hypothetical protein
LVKTQRRRWRDAVDLRTQHDLKHAIAAVITPVDDLGLNQHLAE